MGGAAPLLTKSVSHDTRPSAERGVSHDVLGRPLWRRRSQAQEVAPVAQESPVVLASVYH